MSVCLSVSVWAPVVLAQVVDRPTDRRPIIANRSMFYGAVYSLLVRWIR